MTDHIWFHENLACYAADGLDGEDRERMQEHLPKCKDCTRELETYRSLEKSLGGLFAAAQPRVGLESRMIAGLRAAPMERRIRWVKAMRWVGAAAAVLMLAAVGWGMQHFAETGEMPFGFVAQGDLGDQVVAAVGRRNMRAPKAGPSVRWSVRDQVEELTKAQEGKESREAIESRITISKTKIAGSDPESETSANQKIMGQEARDSTQLSIEDYRRALTEGGDKDGKKLDSSTFSVTRGKEEAEATKSSELALLAKVKELTEEQGKMTKDLESKNEQKQAELPRVTTATTAKPDVGNGASPFGNPFGIMPTTPGASSAPVGGAGGFGGPGTGMPGGGPAPAGQPPVPTAPPSFMPPSAGPKGPDGFGRPTDNSDTSSGKSTSSSNKNSPRGDENYFRALDKEAGDAGKSGEKKDFYFNPNAPAPDAAKGQGSGKGGDDKSIRDRNQVAQGMQEEKKSEKAQEKKEPAAEGKPAEQPKVAQRKIIRTGEVEFEIDVFDNAVGEVTRLITAIPGAFVATVNSDKLPNGKVKGSVVVRVPPDNLDKFLLDVRKELTKKGELKNQRIGSLDVTKQYTDIESRLRAARTMEERLIDIIKKGKGEIKDLLNAERELGVWRTKIEEMEGEIRYFNNQTSLSTITITLYEKEIRLAAAMVITEKVTMRLEVDDVEKAHKSALTAITEAKGRINKADLKQHPAGQYEAVLIFEVAPAAADTVREKLKALGIVTQHDAERLQQAENGGASAAGAEIKSREQDVQFSVTLYNVANIKPREAEVVDLAVPDVAGDYRKLQDAVSAAKGQVRAANLNEQDKLNVTASFDFDVPADARKTIDKLIESLGDVTSHSTSRAAPGETATDRKVGYRLTLRSLSSVPPRESYYLQLALVDVPAEYYKLQGLVSESKGQVRNLSLNEQDRVNTSAQLDFDVPAEQREAIDKMLAGLGETINRTTQRVPPNQIATERRIGYHLTLRNVVNVLPREAHVLNVATQDVAAEYYKVQDAVTAAKGSIRALNLSEQDKTNTTAQIDFVVPTDKRETIDKLLAGLGETTNRSTQRVPPQEIAIDKRVGYRVTLRTFASIPPRETFTLQAVSTDVPAGYRKLQDAVAQAKGFVRSGQLNEPDKTNVSAVFDFDVPSGSRSEIDKLLEEIGDIYHKTAQRVAPGEVATDRKVGYRLTLRAVTAMAPRESIILGIQVIDVDETTERFKKMVIDKGGTILQAPVDHEVNGNVTAHLEFSLPLAAKEEIGRRIRNGNKVKLDKSQPHPQVPETKLATAHFNVFLTNYGPIVPADEGLWARIRTGLSFSFSFLSWSVMFILIGLIAILPWVLLIWIVIRLFRRRGTTAKPQAGPATT